MQTIGIWGLREEARESWDHFVSDKVVSRRVVRGRCRTHTKLYLNRNLWFEIHITRKCDVYGESHFLSMTSSKAGQSVEVIARNRGRKLVKRVQFYSLLATRSSYSQIGKLRTFILNTVQL